MRYLMIDRVFEWTPFRRVVAAKNVSLESDVLEHHFPGFPLFPGDQLRITIEVTEWGPAAVQVTANAAVDGQTTARGRLVLAHRPVDGTVHAEAVRRALEWMRGLERPSGLV